MSLIVLCSAHASPGVTTTALTLAATWPEANRCLLVEADPFGGVIAARYGLGDTPGLSSLAAAARSGFDEETVWRHVRELPGGTAVLVGPVSAEETEVVLRDVAGTLGDWCAEQGEVDVIVDCGRIGPASPTLPLLAKADAVMVVARPSIDQLRPAAHRLAALGNLGATPSLLLVGDSPYGSDEVAATLEVDIAGEVAWDPKTAAVLTGTRATVRDLRRSRLVRSTATLAVHLASRSRGSGADAGTQHAEGGEVELGEVEMVEEAPA